MKIPTRENNDGRYNFHINYDDSKREERVLLNSLIKSKSQELIRKENIRKKEKAAISKKTQIHILNKERERVKLFAMTDSERFMYNTKKELLKRRNTLRDRHKREYLKFIKKEMYRYKDLQSPENKKYNIYKDTKYTNLPLKRCKDSMTSSQVWDMIKNAWCGFKINHGIGYKEGWIYYAKGIQRAVYLLELPPMRDFEEYLGLRPYTFKDELEL